jgi:hypothetical protein
VGPVALTVVLAFMLRVAVIFKLDWKDKKKIVFVDCFLDADLENIIICNGAFPISDTPKQCLVVVKKSSGSHAILDECV